MMNKLARWLLDTGTTRKDFARTIGVVPSYVTLLCSDAAPWPGKQVAERIRDATGGAVTANDFMSPASTTDEPTSHEAVA